MSATLLAVSAVVLVCEVVSLVRHRLRCGRDERALAAHWDATLRRLDEADRRRRRGR